jgi:hypothetical protein
MSHIFRVFQAEGGIPAKRQKDAASKFKPSKPPKPTRKSRKTKIEPLSPGKPIKLEPPSSPSRQPKPPKKTPKTKEISVSPRQNKIVNSGLIQQSVQLSRCPSPLLPLENYSGTNCFFNAIVQLLRAAPEAEEFFLRAYADLPTTLREDDRLRWARDLGYLFTQEGTDEPSVAAMRNEPYFPRALRNGQQDASELLDLVLQLSNRVGGLTLGQLLFTINCEAVTQCLECNYVSLLRSFSAIEQFYLRN